MNVASLQFNFIVPEAFEEIVAGEAQREVDASLRCLTEAVSHVQKANELVLESNLKLLRQVAPASQSTNRAPENTRERH